MTLTPWQGERPFRGVMREISERVAAEADVSLGDLRSPSRLRYIAHPRQKAMAEIRATGRFSLPQIGRFFHRHHTTVLHAVAAHQRRMAEGEGT